MAKAVKLPSGKWSCRVYDKYNKKQVRFTSDSKREAERQASLFQLTLEPRTGSSITFSEAAEQFFANRSETYSPNSIREYKRIYDNDLSEFYNLPVSSITNEDLQSFANRIAPGKNERTVKNKVNLITAILHSVMPEKRFSVKIARTVKDEVKMPSQSEIERLLAVKKSEDMQICIELAVFAGLRRAEICALTSDDLVGGCIHIGKAVAQAESGAWVIKAPKTATSDRYIRLPESLAEKLSKREGKLVKLSPNSVSNDFPRIAKRAGVDVTFHQLRHWSSSYLHSEGVSEAEIIKRFGWSKGYTFKNVYRHSFDMSRSDDAISRLSMTNS